MRHFFSTALHFFVIFMMVIFVIGAILAITGNFDHWTERYRLKRRRRRLLRKRSGRVAQTQLIRSTTLPMLIKRPPLT